MTAEIISVGTELLLGDIVNTNAAFLSVELAKCGVNVFCETTIGDNHARLEAAFDAAFGRGADVIITTGGLGPTADDLTKETAAKYFCFTSVLHEPSLERMKARFAAMRRDMPESNVKQAFFPTEAVVLPNNNGTAPGCILKKEEKTIICLPGPPHEMEPMYRESVAAYLSEKTGETFVSRSLHLMGIGESEAAERVSDLFELANPTIAPYAKPNGVTLRLTAKAKTREQALEIIEPVALEIYKRLGSCIYGEGETTVEAAVVEALKKRGLTVAVAESCTGGFLAVRLTDVPGASEVLREGVVVYSNEAKVNRLGVSEKTLAAYGAVSRQTAAEMAEGIVKTSGADAGISVTGIAGPGGGTPEKPVGLVFVGVCVNGKAMTKELRLNGDRRRIRERAAVTALFMMLEELRKH